jgi:hypothetical protein
MYAGLSNYIEPACRGARLPQGVPEADPQK